MESVAISVTVTHSQLATAEQKDLTYSVFLSASVWYVHSIISIIERQSEIFYVKAHSPTEVQCSYIPNCKYSHWYTKLSIFVSDHWRTFQWHKTNLHHIKFVMHSKIVFLRPGTIIGNFCASDGVCLQSFCCSSYKNELAVFLIAKIQLFLSTELLRNPTGLSIAFLSFLNIFNSNWCYWTLVAIAELSA